MCPISTTGSERHKFVWGSLQLLVLSHGGVHTRWPAVPSCESQLRFSYQSEAEGNCWSVFQQSELGSTPHKRTVLPLVVHGFSPHTPYYYEIFSTVEREPLQCPEFLRLLLSGSSEFCLKMARTRGVIYTHRQHTHFQKNLFSNQRTWRTSVSWKVGVDGKAQYVWFSCLLIVQWW